MKPTFTFTLIFCFWGALSFAQTSWTGPTITFSKANNADWTQAANQDSMTATMILTRANHQGLFNIVYQASYNSPVIGNARWAYGTLADGISNLTFDSSWYDFHGGNPTSLIDTNAVLHIVSEDIYVDFKLTSWTSGGAGGGFSYQRSTPNFVNINTTAPATSIKVYPNPAIDFISLEGLKNRTSFVLYNALGREVLEGDVEGNERIALNRLEKGMYFLRLDNNGTVQKIIKQ